MPFIIGFAAFTVYPLIISLIKGLQVTGTDGTVYGLDNFITTVNDESFRNATLVTLRYTAILVPLKLTVSLLTALLLNIEIKGMGVFRTIFYIPSILGANLSIVIMWQYLFTSDGLVNQLLEYMGLSPVSWYGESAPATAIIILLRLWEFGSSMIIFLAALRDIPPDYYNAAKLDGCGRVRAFFKITLPLLKNVIFVNAVLQIISAMQEFNAPYMITGVNPMKSTYTISMLIYDLLFRDWNFSGGYTVSWLFFIIISAIITIMYIIAGKFGEKNE
jgi:oligogalacturonide transport system permease protein